MSVARKRVIRTGIPAGLAIRNDAGGDMAAVLAKIAEINTTFEAFKGQNDAAIAEIRAGKPDVVTTEHVTRINNEMTRLTGELTALQAAMTAMRVGGAANDTDENPHRKAHRAAFNKWFRKGTDKLQSELEALQIQAAMSTDSNPDGGYVVPVEHDTAMTRVLETVSAMRRLATVRSISTNSYTKPHNLGGTTSGWVGEHDTRADTANPSIAKLEFPTMELYAQPLATQTFLDDAALEVESWLAGEVAIEFAEEEGDAFIDGDGNKKPRGILSYTKVANASYAWGKTGFVVTGASGAFVTVSASANPYDNLIDLYHALKPGYRAGASWLMNDAVLASVRKIKANDGTYVYQPPTAAEPASVLGKTIEIDDNMPDIAANSYSIAIGDFGRGYLIVDRIGTRVLRDPYTSKPYVKFYVTKRVGGGIQDFAAIKLLKFGTS